MIETRSRYGVEATSRNGIDAPGGGTPADWGLIAGAKPAGQSRAERSSLLGELGAALGESAASRLIEAFGGSRIYVPHFPRPGDSLVSQIGMVAAAKLVRIYGGERLDLPNPNSRRTRILELRRGGLSVDAIARQIGCTRRRVFQVLAEARPRRAEDTPSASRSPDAGSQQAVEQTISTPAPPTLSLT